VPGVPGYALSFPDARLPEYPAEPLFCPWLGPPAPGVEPAPPPPPPPPAPTVRPPYVPFIDAPPPPAPPPPAIVP